MEAYLRDKQLRGLAESSIVTYRNQLTAMIGHVLPRPLRGLRDRGPELYQRVLTYQNGHRWAGEGRAADTHRTMLQRAHDFARFCIKQRWLRVDPWREVEPCGRIVKGSDKVRLTTDESRQLEGWCLERLDDQDAVLTLAYLYLGARASELCRRTVRDLDDNGAVLRIGRTKTEAGRRSLAMPPVLRDALRALTAGRAPDAPVFLDSRGERMSRFTAWRRVRKYTKNAGVTIVPPQAMRRTNASLAAEISEIPLAIARHLGHATGAAPAVTSRSYVNRDAAAVGAVRQVMRAIRGDGRPDTTTEIDTGEGPLSAVSSSENS